MSEQDSSQPNDKMNDGKPPKKTNQNQKMLSSGLYTSQDL
jgi:hypothetical protein